MIARNNVGREILKDIIENFSTEKFINFFRKKNSSFTPAEEILDLNREYFGSGKKIGEIKLQDDYLIICAFQTGAIHELDLTERSGKKKQYELGKDILKKTNSDAGIFIFYDRNGNFRFSLIYTDYHGTRRKFSYFKRFTYFVGKGRTNKTFLDQISEGDFSSLEKIKEAFSVEPVTKQFYEEIQNWYFWAMDKAKFPDDYKYSDAHIKDTEIRNSLNLIRLITRIIFIWFLRQKEHLIPDALFDKNKLRGIIKDFSEGDNYYNAILQNLFFATLNQKMHERRFAHDKGYLANKTEYGVKTLYRYKEKFLISEHEVLQLFEEIPFLNGGLLDCLDREDETGKVVYIDGFSRNPRKRAIIPDYLFFQEQEVTVDLSEYGIGSSNRVRGLIEILRNYNFTIDENTPIDQEVALDPELLGKVFENLLASYNPETATTARKATGSYYTPREIVDYMVDESLRHYFNTHLPAIDEDKIDLLLSYSDEVPEFSNEERKMIITSIDRVKILDPACGSGAFPMGILHKLVHVLQKIDPGNKYWHELQCQKALEASEEAFKEKNKLEREEMLKMINEVFDQNINYPDYARKLYLIENCIYGVDIQPIAIQISKLRFFISLVLDQKVDRRKDNLGIRALPNLETKFVSANTLIELDRPEQLLIRNVDIEWKEKELKDVRHRYFIAKTRAAKFELREKDRKIRREIAQLLITDGWGEQSAHKISSFDLFDQNASADWFDPEWMFGVAEGFDMVIGNPPYVRQEVIGGDKAKIIQSTLHLWENIKINKRSDLYVYFYYKGLSLLKPNGIFCFINSNSWLDVGYGGELQEFLLKRMKPLMIVDNISERSVPAHINTVIVLIQRPKDGVLPLHDTIKFIVFKKPFSKILDTDILKQIHYAKEKIINEDFRLITKTRKELWIEGIDTEDEEINEKEIWNYKYNGNKWGGKYLRAPEIFFKILEKGKDKLVRLGDIAVIEGYIHSFNIGDRFPKVDFIESTEDAEIIMLNRDAPGVKKYGVKDEGNSRRLADLLFPRMIGNRFLTLINYDKVYGQKFYKIILKPNFKRYKKSLGVFLNSTVQFLQNEVIMLSPWGLGALSVNSDDVQTQLVLYSIIYDKHIKVLTRPIKSIFEELGFQKCTQRNCNHPEHPYEHVKPEEIAFDRIMPDRRELDKIVFEALCLTEEEQLEVYRAVIELVKNRLLKAKSK